MKRRYTMHNAMHKFDAIIAHNLKSFLGVTDTTNAQQQQQTTKNTYRFIYFNVN